MVHFFFKSNSPSEPACKFETSVKVVIIITRIFLIIFVYVYYNGKQITLLLDCFWPERFLLPVAADAKSAISAAQDAACCESAALHNPAFLAFLKTAQEWIDSYIRSNTTVENLDDEQL